MSGVRQPAWNEAESTRLVHGSRHRATRSVVLCAVSQAHAVRVVSHPGRHLVVPAARRYLTIEALEIEDEASMAAAADEYFGQLMDGATTAQPGTSATSTLLVLPAPPVLCLFCPRHRSCLDALTASRPLTCSLTAIWARCSQVHAQPAGHWRGARGLQQGRRRPGSRVTESAVFWPRTHYLVELSLRNYAHMGDHSTANQSVCPLVRCL